MPVVKRKRDYLTIFAGETWRCANCGRFNPCDELPYVDASWSATFDRPEIECSSCRTVYTVEESDTVQATIYVAARQAEHLGGRNTVAELDVARRAKREQARRDALRRVQVPDDDPVLAAVSRAEEAVQHALEARAYAYFEAAQKYSLRQLESALPASLATIQRRAAEGRKLHDDLEVF